MLSSLIHITPDRWFIMSGIFAILSFFTPKRIPLIISGTAFITATLNFIYPFMWGCPLSTAIQLAIFSVLLILGLLFIQTGTPSPHLSLKKKDILTLSTPIKNGKGIYAFEGRDYTVIGPDCPAQTQVIIVSIKDNTLYINPMSE